MKNVFSIIVLFMALNATAKVIDWKLLKLIVPDSWESKKTPMASVGGYYLHTKINNKKHRFFITTDRPKGHATKTGSERYFKEYLETFEKGGSFTCKYDHSNYGYQCHSFLKKNGKWSIKLMYWYQDKERLILNLEGLSKKGEAQTILNEIKVGFP